MITQIFFFVIVLIYAAFAFYWVQAFFKGAPYYPSNKKIVKKMIKAMGLDEKSKVAELGAGDGRIAFAISKTGAHVTAIEINPFFVLLMKLKNIFHKNKIKAIRANVLDHDYSQYNAVTIYLYPGLMHQLEDALFSQMKKGSVIVSNTFRFKKHEPERVIENRVVIYRVN